MKNYTLKHLMLLVLAAAFLALPVVAKADAFTFNAPATAANSNSSSNNPTQSDYRGSNQFKLDHHLAYTWRLSAFGADYANNPLVVGASDLSNKMFLDSDSFGTEATTYTLHLTSGQLAQLAAYIANGNDFAFGFDANRHVWNNGIKSKSSFITSPSSVPEPGTMLLLGFGAAGLAYFQRRRHAHKRH